MICAYYFFQFFNGELKYINTGLVRVLFNLLHYTFWAGGWILLYVKALDLDFAKCCKQFSFPLFRERNILFKRSQFGCTRNKMTATFIDYFSNARIHFQWKI
jgi:hypothetical protein